MDRREQVTRLRAIITGAVSRGQFNAEERMRTALQRAEDARKSPYYGLLPGAPYPIRRRNLIAQISQKQRHYGLRDDVDEFVYALGREGLNGLDLEQLDSLNSMLVETIDDMQLTCDWRHCPPAR